MRTSIKDNLFQRILLQAEEAEFQKMERLASNLTAHLEKVAVRPDDEPYSYSKKEFDSDIMYHLWSAALRTADFHNISRIDAVEVAELLEKHAEEIVNEICIKAGITHGVGAYEPSLPGEVVPSIEVEE